MPIPMTLPVAQPTMPGAGVPPPGPGAAAASLGNPLAALAGAGGGGSGMPGGMQQFLIFLAGMGFPEFERTMTKMRNPHGKQGGKSALGKEAAGNPNQTQVSQQLLAQLAARRAQAQMGAGAAQQPQPNPLAQLMPGR